MSFLKLITSEQGERLSKFKNDLEALLEPRRLSIYPGSFVRGQYAPFLSSELVNIKSTVEIVCDINSIQHYSTLKCRVRPSPDSLWHRGSLMNVTMDKIENGLPITLGVRSPFSFQFQPEDSSYNEMKTKGFIEFLDPIATKEINQQLLPNNVMQKRIDFINHMGYHTVPKDLETQCLGVKPEHIEGLTENLVLVPVCSRFTDYLEEFNTPTDPIMSISLNPEIGNVYTLATEELCMKVKEYSEHLQEDFNFMQQMKEKLQYLDIELVPVNSKTLLPEKDFFAAFQNIKIPASMGESPNVNSDAMDLVATHTVRIHLNLKVYVPSSVEPPRDVSTFVFSDQFAFASDETTNKHFIIQQNTARTIATGEDKSDAYLIEPWQARDLLLEQQ